MRFYSLRTTNLTSSWEVSVFYSSKDLDMHAKPVGPYINLRRSRIYLNTYTRPYAYIITYYIQICRQTTYKQTNRQTEEIDGQTHRQHTHADKWIHRHIHTCLRHCRQCRKHRSMAHEEVAEQNTSGTYNPFLKQCA